MKRSAVLLILAAGFASMHLVAAPEAANVQTAVTTPTTDNRTRPVTLDEIKKLSGQDVSSDIIIKLMQSQPAIYELNANEIADLTAANVKPEVIDYLLSTHRLYQPQASSTQAPAEAQTQAPAETTMTTASPAATAPLVPTAPVDPGYAGYPTYPAYPYPYGYYYPPSYYYGPSFGFAFGAPVFFDGHGHSHNDFHGGSFHGGHVTSFHGGGFHGGTVHSVHAGGGGHGGHH